MCALVVAAVVERRRLALLRAGDVVENVVSGRHYKAADMSVFYLVPQYALMGLSEVFASITGLEFVYDYSPRSMRSVAMALYLGMQGLGSFIGSALVNVVNACHARGCVKWIPKTPPQWKTAAGPVGGDPAVRPPPRHGAASATPFPSLAPTPFPSVPAAVWGHMDWYFFLLAGIMVPNVLVFVAVARRFRVRGGKFPRRYGTGGTAPGDASDSDAPKSPASLASAASRAMMSTAVAPPRSTSRRCCTGPTAAATRSAAAEPTG